MTLTKSANGLGFSFVMCELDPPIRDFGSLVRIKQLFDGQPAQQSGRIQEGDVLLAINGQSIKELSYPVCADFKIKFSSFKLFCDYLALKWCVLMICSKTSHFSATPLRLSDSYSYSLLFRLQHFTPFLANVNTYLQIYRCRI